MSEHKNPLPERVLDFKGFATVSGIWQLFLKYPSGLYPGSISPHNSGNPLWLAGPSHSITVRLDMGHFWSLKKAKCNEQQMN
jgi:hypothetical protein